MKTAEDVEARDVVGRREKGGTWGQERGSGSGCGAGRVEGWAGLDVLLLPRNPYPPARELGGAASPHRRSPLHRLASCGGELTTVEGAGALVWGACRHTSEAHY